MLPGGSGIEDAEVALKDVNTVLQGMSLLGRRWHFMYLNLAMYMHTA